VPFDIPDSWEWVRLSDIVDKEIKRGKSPKYAEYSNVYVFAQKCNVKAGGIDISLSKYLDTSTFDKYPVEEYMRDGDIVVNSTGNGTLGRIGLFRDSDRLDNNVIVPDSHVTVVRACSAINTEYLFYVLKYHQPALEKLGEGSTNQTELKPSNIAELLIPFPPINEQIRIATKLSDVDSLIVAYGNSSAKLDAYNQSFPEQLKKSILQWAVQGKLVPQNENDEPAEILLERIRAEKEALIKAGKIKRDKHESVIFRRDNSHYEKRGSDEICIDNELPFTIPSTWAWCRISTIGNIVRGSGIKRTETTESGLPCVRYGEIYTSYNISFEETKSFISPTLDKQCKHFAHGDIVFTLTGENKPDIAKAVAYMGNTPVAAGGDLAYWEHHGMNPLYLVFLMASPYVINCKVELATGDIIVHISGDKIGSILVPIPPLKEQERIVARILEMFQLCKDF